MDVKRTSIRASSRSKKTMSCGFMSTFLHTIFRCKQYDLNVKRVKPQHVQKPTIKVHEVVDNYQGEGNFFHKQLFATLTDGLI